MGTPASLLDLIARGGGYAAAIDNSAKEAQTNDTNQRAALTQSQVPLVAQQTEEARLRNQVTQRQLRDEEIQRSIFGEVGKSVSAPPVQAQAPPTAGQGAPVPGMVGVTTGDLQPAPQQAPPPPAPNYLSDPRAFASEMAKRGASAPAVMGSYKAIIDLNKNLAGLSKDQLEVEGQQHAQVAASLQGYLNTPDAQKPQVYGQFYQDAITSEPNLKQELPAPTPGTAPTEADLAHVIGKVHLFGTLLTNAKEKAATKASEASARASDASALNLQADADKKNALLPGELAGQDTKNKQDALTLAGTSKEGITAKDLREAGERAFHNRQTEAAARSEIALKQKQFDATLGSGLDANGQPLSPEAMKAAALQDPTAQAIAHYQIQGPPAQTRGGVTSPILRKVLAINPQYDGTQFAARNKVQQDFSAAGSSGKLITSADTALAHLDTISKAGAALNNSNIPALNQLANALGVQVGSTPKVTYDTIVSMVSPEISKAVIGEAGGEGERQKMRHNFGSSASQAQREGAIAAAAGLLGARVHKQAQAYESSIGAPLDLTKRLSPESQAVMQRYAGGGSGPKAPAVGTIEDGHRFKGGNPADRNSWEAAK